MSLQHPVWEHEGICPRWGHTTTPTRRKRGYRSQPNRPFLVSLTKCSLGLWAFRAFLPRLLERRPVLNLTVSPSQCIITVILCLNFHRLVVRGWASCRRDTALRNGGQALPPVLMALTVGSAAEPAMAELFLLRKRRAARHGVINYIQFKGLHCFLWEGWGQDMPTFLHIPFLRIYMELIERKPSIIFGAGKRKKDHC